MKKQFVKLLVLMGLIAMGTILFGVSALAEDPITRNIEITPKVLTGAGTVRVSINITNTSDDGGAISVTLFDPNNQVCQGFGSGGTANLSPGASASYSGNWSVTQSQLDAGKVTYTARYSVTDENGVRVQVTRPIAASITHNKANAQLKVKRIIEPGSTVMQGQTVKIRYTIENAGTLDIKNITISDPDIVSEPVKHALLAVGESTELSYTFVAGSASKTTQAEIQYEYEINGKTEKPKAEKADPITIEVTIPNLVVQLTGKQIVTPGEKIDLTYVITNKSDLSYEQLKITDKVLGDIDSNLSLAAGKSLQGTKNITVSAAQTHQLIVTGVDSANNDVIYQSNELTIQTTETESDSSVIGVVPVMLDILIEADRDVIYEMPSDVIFRVKVTNNGSNALEKVDVGAAGKTIKRIDRIEPGETKEFLIQLRASMGGQYQFTATAKDNTGADSSAESNIFPIEYKKIEEPVTPPPPPVEPDPTEFIPVIETVEQTETPPPFGVPEEEGRNLGTILLWVLGGLLGLIVVAVLVLFFLDKRRGRAIAPSGGSGGGSYAPAPKGQTKVIDSIQRVPHRDYSRAPKRGSSTGQPAPRARQGGDSRMPDPIPVSTIRGDDYDGIDTPPVSVNRERTPSAIDPMEATTTYKRPTRPAAPLFELDEKQPARTAADYARPTTTPRNVFDEMPTRSMDDTAVYSSNYFDEPQDAPARSRRPSEEETSTKLTDEQAALMSGSTGQYRLSSKKGSVRGTARPASQIVEPEDFARKQKIERIQPQPRDLSDLDGDDDLTP